MTRKGEPSPSAARSFTSDQVAELSEFAQKLPSDWVLRVEPPYGQLAFTPIRGLHWHVDCLVCSPSGRSGPVSWRRLA